MKSGRAYLMVARAEWTFMPRFSMRKPATSAAEREMPH